MLRANALCAVLIGALGPVAVTQAQASFTLISTGPYSPCLAFGLSGNGATVVGTGNFSEFTNPEPWRWTRSDGTVSLGLSEFSARVASYDASVIAVIQYSRVYRFINGTVTMLPSETVTPFTATGISRDGDAIAGRTVGSQYPHPYRWTLAGGTEDLGLLPGFTSGLAKGLSATGDVVVGTLSGPAGDRAFRWTAAGGMQDLGVLSGFSSCQGWAISADGTTIVGCCFLPDIPYSLPFIWTSMTGMRALPILPGSIGPAATAVSGDGSVVAGWHGTGVFVWCAATGVQDLRLTLTAYGAVVSAQLRHYVMVSYDGRTFAGQGTSGGYYRGWIATLPPTFACYPNCDGSSIAPALNISDFSCYLSRFHVGDPYANCDNSTTPPILNVFDFICFLNRFAAGCP